jgi:hypothetical protein
MVGVSSRNEANQDQIERRIPTCTACLNLTLRHDTHNRLWAHYFDDFQTAIT